VDDWPSAQSIDATLSCSGKDNSQNRSAPQSAQEDEFRIGQFKLNLQNHVKPVIGLRTDNQG